MSCPDCFQGHAHEGQPSGKITKLHGLDTYVSEPADGRPARGIIVVIPDAFGWDFVNTRLLADRYADKGGYKVYLPDFMGGQLILVLRSRSILSFLDCRVLGSCMDARLGQGGYWTWPLPV
jgi:hypothetical protein